MCGKSFGLVGDTLYGDSVCCPYCGHDMSSDDLREDEEDDLWENRPYPTEETIDDLLPSERWHLWDRMHKSLQWDQEIDSEY